MRNLLLLLSLVVVAFCAEINRSNRAHHGGGGGGGGGGDQFDSFKLTQIYPQAACHADDEAIADVCVVPADADKWTLHGLWPDRDDGTYPQFCSRKKFDASLVAPIEHQLEVNWPNLLHKKSTYSLWQHEWEKHGTCSVSIAGTSNELNYFSKSLELHAQYPIYSALKAHGIVPSSDQTYSAALIQEALEDSFGAKVQINCLHDKIEKDWLLGDVRICLSKDFKAINCPEKRQRSELDENSALPAYQPCPKDKIKYLCTGSSPLNAFNVVKRDMPSSAPLQTMILSMISALIMQLVGNL